MNKNFSVKNGIEIGVADGTAPITTTSTTKVVNLNSDKLDDQEGSYYLDWTNTTNKPDPVVTVTLTGDVTGTANTTLTDLGNGTVSVATTIAANSVALGTDTTGNYVADVTAGTYITKSGTAAEGWSPTINVDATSANTVSKVVARDSSGNFSAGTITAALSGNASTSTKLSTARNIALSGDVTGSVDFDGSQNVSITATISAASVNLTTDVSGALPVANGGTGVTTSTGSGKVVLGTSPTITAIRETKVEITNTNIDLNLGNLFTKVLYENIIFSISNALSSGTANSFILELANAGAYVITWFSGVKWAGGTAPTLTTDGVDILGFYSHDGGATWRGMVLAKDSK
jgi:hypothetical protein